MPLDMRRASGGGRRVQLVNVKDFTGGLNLTTDTIKLKPNESPDLLNVDIDGRGGFQLRKGVDAWTSAAGTELTTGTRFVCNDSGGSQTEECTLWHATTGKTYVVQSDGTMVAHTSAGSVNNTKRRFAVFNNVLYSVGDYPTASALKWAGAWTSYGVSWDYTTLTSDGGATWQADITAPTTGYFVRGQLIAAHMNYMWVGNVYETQQYPNRVRWSHPGQPENWRQIDYIDVAVGQDKDQITALVPFSDHLLVFKGRSVHAIFGYDPDSFQVVPITAESGTPSQESVVATEAGVYWWDVNNGLMHYDGKRVRWLGEQLHRALQEDDIPRAYGSTAYVGWVNRRVWCSVPYGDGATDRTHSFVYDPSQESWTLYDLAAGPFVTAFSKELASLRTTKRVFDLHGSASADLLDGSTATHIDSYYRTAWIDMGAPAVKKRWKGMEAILVGGSDSSVRCQVYQDYNQSDPQGEFTMSLSTGGTDFDWGEDWDEHAWAAGTTYDTIVKGSGMGVARSVSLKFIGPEAQDVEWGVNGFTLKTIPKRVR